MVFAKMSIFKSKKATEKEDILKEEAMERNYFDILFRKFWYLTKTNLLYVFVNILFFGGFYFLLLPFLYSSPETFENILNDMIKPIARGEVLIPVIYFIPFIFIGPSTAGLTYITRNFARQEHAFIWSDFFETMKKNFKQSFLMGILLTLLVYFYCTAVIYYINAMGLNAVSVLICLFMGIILASISFYVYPIMITFKMSFFEILKNSVILTFGRLFQNTVILFIISAVHILLLWFALPVWFILMIAFLFSWTSFTINYHTWNVISRYMIDDKENNDEEDGVNEEENN